MVVDYIQLTEPGSQGEGDDDENDLGCRAPQLRRYVTPIGNSQGEVTSTDALTVSRYLALDLVSK